MIIVILDIQIWLTNGMAGITMDGVNVQQKIKLYLLQNQNVGK